MTAIYGLALALGVAALLAWIAAVAIAESVEGWAFADPEQRFGRRGRLGVAAIMGFGLAGMSASFAGWHGGLALLAALGGAGAVGAIASILGPETDIT